MDALGRSSGSSEPTRVRQRAAPLIASPVTTQARWRHGDSSHRPPRYSLSSLPSRPHSTRRLSPKRYDNRYEVEERTNCGESPFRNCLENRDVSRNRGSGGGQKGSKGPDRPLLGADEALSKDPRLFSKQFLHARL